VEGLEMGWDEKFLLIVKRFAVLFRPMTKQAINKAIRHLGVEIQHKRGDGYCYFTSIETGETMGDESVMVCHLKHLTLEQWVEEAKEATR
jgi:hypothetical protein